MSRGREFADGAATVEAGEGGDAPLWRALAEVGAQASRFPRSTAARGGALLRGEAAHRVLQELLLLR